jgi:hypothetical protein
MTMWSSIEHLTHRQLHWGTVTEGEVAQVEPMLCLLRGVGMDAAWDREADCQGVFSTG